MQGSRGEFQARGLRLDFLQLRCCRGVAPVAQVSFHLGRFQGSLLEF